MTKFFGYRSIIATSTGELAQLTGIDGPGVDFAEVDTTTMDSSSNYRTSAPGLGGPGDVTLNMMYDPTSASHKVLARAAQNRTTKAWTVYHGSSSGDTDVFSAWVKSINRTIPMDNMIVANVTIHITGLPGYTT